MSYSGISALQGATLCLLWLAAGAAAQLAVAPSAKQETSADTTTNILRGAYPIRRLSPETAAKELAVRFTGVVIWKRTEPHGFVIHDGEEGIYVALQKAIDEQVFQPVADIESLVGISNRLEIEGVTQSGQYAPVIVPRSLRLLGTAPLPAPIIPNHADFITGRIDCQRIRHNGIVIAVNPAPRPGHYELLLLTVRGEVKVWLPRPPDHTLEQMQSDLLNAHARVTGCAISLYNARSELIGVRVDSNLASDLEILSPPPADLFDAQEVSLSRIRAFAPGRTFLRRVKVRGVVLKQRPRGYLFIHEAGRSIQVFYRGDEIFRPGDLVEAAGLVTYHTMVGAMERAVVRKVGEGQLPDSMSVTISRLLASGGNVVHEDNVEDLDGVLVRFEATVVTADTQTNLRNELGLLDEHHLLVKGDDSLRLARVIIPLPKSQASLVQAFRPGARLAITAVANLNYGEAQVPTIRPPRPSGVRFLVNSPADIQILKRAPLWTTARLRFAAWVIGIGVLTVALWIGVLRRQLRIRRAEVRRVASEAGALAERQRIARELHDSLEQGLAGVSMQLEGLATRPAAIAPASRGDFDRLRNMLRHVREEARHSVWELRSEFLRSDGLVGAVRQFAALSTPECRVSVDVVGQPSRLSERTEINLLRIAQEAVGNALRHGRPSLVTVQLVFASDSLSLSVADNGCGFDPAAPISPDRHFGLLGMRERARLLPARLTVDSAPGRGTTVSVTLDLKESIVL